MISAVVHTYNEEKTIERCLSSLQWADEIILVDMGSTDDTCNKAKQLKANIYKHPYTGFVEPARNFGIEKAKGKWILVLDADEEIPRLLANELTHLTNSSNYTHIRLPRKNIIFGKWIKHSGWWPDYQVRFFQKGFVNWTDKIHSIPLTKGESFEIEASEKYSIVHYNYQTLEQFLIRLNRYTSITAKELYLSNHSISIKDFFTSPTKEFIQRFFIWEGYKDGFHGLALSLLQGVSQLIVYLKLWELDGFTDQKVNLDDIEKALKEEYFQKKYWLLNEKMKQSKSSVEKTILKIRRKMMHYA